MKFYVIPESVRASSGRPIQRKEFYRFDACTRYFVSTNEFWDDEVYNIGFTDYEGSYKLYKNEKTNELYLAKGDEPVDRWKPMGRFVVYANIQAHCDHLIYSLRKEKRSECRTRIKNIETDHETILDADYGAALCGVGSVVVMIGGDPEQFTGIDVKSGKVVWWSVPPRIPLQDRYLFVKPYGMFARVYIDASKESWFSLTEIETGRVMLELPLGAPAIWTAPMFQDNRLYVHTKESVVIVSMDSMDVRTVPIKREALYRSMSIRGERLYLAGSPQSEDNVARLTTYDLATGNKLSEYIFPEYINYSAPAPMGDYLVAQFTNRDEMPHWTYNRLLVFKPEELDTQASPIEKEPIQVQFQRELIDGDESRYRIVMPTCDHFETFLWQMELGAHSCATVNAINLNVESKPFDEDFAGQIIMDCRNMKLDKAQKDRLRAAAKDVEETLDQEYVDAIKQKRIKIKFEF